VAGTRLYDPWRAAAAAAAAGAALSALLFGGVSLTSVAAPALAAVWLVQRAPKLAASLERWRVARERAAAAAGGGAGSAASWDAYGFVRAYADFEEAQREREEEAEAAAARERAQRRRGAGQQSQWQQQWQEQWRGEWQGRPPGGGGGGRGPAAGAAGGGASASDPQGLYAALGVAPDCTAAELQASFRGLALRHHPDRVPAGDKAAATARFQHLTAAYNVLRDPKRRRAYDETGRA
jgi:hypothetical protein